MDNTNLVKEIKKYGSFKRVALNYSGGLFFAFWVSPYLSAFAVKRGVKPNQLTKCMIPAAIIGSVLFAVPNIWVKILGAIGMHVFYLFDLADGQVARATKEFSLYGEQLDHISHHCSHVFLLFSITLSLFQLNNYSNTVLFLLGGGMLFAEYAFRNICSIETEIKLIDKYEGKTEEAKAIKSSIFTKLLILLKSILFMFRAADNYILFACVLYFIDWFLGTNIVFILSCIFIVTSVVRNIYVTLQLIRHTKKRE